MDRATGSLLLALGYTPEASRLYERLLPLNGRAVEEALEVLGVGRSAFEEATEPLREYEIVVVDLGVLRVRSLTEVISAMLRITAERARQNHDRIVRLSEAIPHLGGSVVRAPAAHVEDERPIDGELLTSGSMLRSLQAMIHEAAGDVVWLRPDMFSIDYTRDLDTMLEAGRQIRAIYPARARVEAPGALAINSAHGEQIRLMPEVPCRLMAIANTVAVLPEPFGLGSSPRIVVRQRALVDLAEAYFDALWAQATPLRTMRNTDATRRLLLQQLAAGDQDEQIARRFGVSLRTIRRRVAELMEELGAESRFQAGVEAARRGWI